MGFSFKGKSCEELGLVYFPQAEDRRANFADFKNTEISSSYKHGKYYFGTSFEAREFSLRCVAEDITQAQEEAIWLLFAPGEQGRLVFDDRPLVYYDVTVTKKPTVQTYVSSTISGRPVDNMVVTIFQTAYSPFGKLSITENDGTVEAENAVNYSGILPSGKMPEADFAVGETTLVYNPGAFESDTVIRIAGTAADGVTIRNLTNGDSCRLLSLPSSPDYLELSSETGMIHQLPSYPDALAYSYHDDGFIRLSSGWKDRRTVYVNYESGSNAVYSPVGIVTSEDEGLYIWLTGKWLRIASVTDSHHFVVSESLASTGAAQTDIVLMNEIRIEGNGAELTKFELEYTPLMR